MRDRTASCPTRREVGPLRVGPSWEGRSSPVLSRGSVEKGKPSATWLLPMAVDDRAAVDVQGLPGHVAGSFRREEVDGVRDLLRRGEAPHGDQPRHLRLVEQARRDRALHPLRHRVAGGDALTRMPASAHSTASTRVRLSMPALGRAVGESLGDADCGGDRGDADDRCRRRIS